jgi:signal transduction histidine kinase
MNLYSKKLSWKIILALIALVITSGFLWYSSYISGQASDRNERELEKWSRTIVQQADVVKLANEAFEQLKLEEKRKAQIWVRATKEFENNISDFSLSTDLRESIKIPLITVDENDQFLDSVNLNMPSDIEGFDSIIQRYITNWQKLNEPLQLSITQFDITSNYKIIYNNSDKYYRLSNKKESLVKAFNMDLSRNTGLVPFVFIDSASNKLLATNISGSELNSGESVLDKIPGFRKANGRIRIDLGSNVGYIYHDVDPLQQQLLLYPYIQLGIIALFILVGYFLFSTFRRAEQNQVWAGMAKETAHQLGTPLSSLMAWIEYLKSQGIEETTIVEMNKDVQRLEMITDRFSKIGSETKLEPTDVLEVIEGIVGYLRARISSKVDFILPEHNGIVAQLNVPLFEWVIENLSKNAVDAMSGKGSITFSIKEIGSQVHIEITDTGKGIPSGKLKTVFQPGYTTKKRGWGLGLSLVKRIVENFHRGKISVSKSEINVGTTFRIILNS